MRAKKNIILLAVNGIFVKYITFFLMHGIWRSSSFLPLLPFTTLPHFLQRCLIFFALWRSLCLIALMNAAVCCAYTGHCTSTARLLSTLPGQPQGSKPRHPSLKHSCCPAQSNVGAAAPPSLCGCPQCSQYTTGSPSEEAWAIPAACQTEGVCASTDMWEEATADLLYF